MKKTIWLILSCLMIAALVLTSCTKETVEEEEEEEIIPGENWWDKFGEPEYGGTIYVQHHSIETSFDPYAWFFYAPYHDDRMFIHDWTLDRSIWKFQGHFTPEVYNMGNLAESWKWQDLQTIVINLRKDIHWHDKPPVNGRQFTTDDVIYHFDRMLGTGSGFTEPNPNQAGFAVAYDKVTAIDKYTFEVKFKEPSGFVNSQSMFEPILQMFECRELIESGDIEDFNKVAGTGPFMLDDYVSGASLTLVKNPKYHGYDERHPQNRLPYVDGVKILEIPDPATSLSALRTGKIDYLLDLSWEQAASLEKTNPELNQIQVPASGLVYDFRVDKEPFTDINVRKALNMSIDRELIAETHYGGIVEGTPCGILSPDYPGWFFPYEDWPQSLKDEYSYNPDRARELLAEAGYPNGFQTNVVTSDNADLEVQQIIKGYLADIGVDLDIRVMEFAARGAFVTAMKHDQMSQWNSFAGHIPNISIESFYSTEPRNSGAVNDPGYDAIVDRFRKAKDVDEAKRIGREADRYFIEHHWELTLFNFANYRIWQPYLKGYSGEILFLWHINGYWARMWIDQDLKASMGR